MYTAYLSVSSEYDSDTIPDVGVKYTARHCKVENFIRNY